MIRNKCIYCGSFIMKSAINDPYLCRECEKLVQGTEMTEKYDYLDNY